MARRRSPNKRLRQSFLFGRGQWFGMNGFRNCIVGREGVQRRWRILEPLIVLQVLEINENQQPRIVPSRLWNHTQRWVWWYALWGVGMSQDEPGICVYSFTGVSMPIRWRINSFRAKIIFQALSLPNIFPPCPMRKKMHEDRGHIYCFIVSSLPDLQALRGKSKMQDGCWSIWVELE